MIQTEMIQTEMIQTEMIQTEMIQTEMLPQTWEGGLNLLPPINQFLSIYNTGNLKFFYLARFFGENPAKLF